MSMREQSGNVERNKETKAEVSQSGKYQKPQLIPVASTVELVQGYAFCAPIPDGYTGYYKCV